MDKRFIQAHREARWALGLTLLYLLAWGLAAYLPAQYAKRHLDAGELYLVPGAPTFPYPVWAVWRADLEPGLKDAAAAALREVVRSLHDEQDRVIETLEEISGAPAGSLPDVETNFSYTNVVSVGLTFYF